MRQTISQFFDAHPWLVRSIAAVITIIVVLYKVSKAFIDRMYQMILRWHYGRYDANTHTKMPWNAVTLRELTKLLRTSRKKLVGSMRRLEKEGKVIPLHVDEEPDDEVWKKL